MSYVICNVSLELLTMDPYTSTATLTSVSSNDNGAVLTCKNTFSSTPEPEQTVNVTLVIQGTM